jgi:hypothetical protein
MIRFWCACGLVLGLATSPVASGGRTQDSAVRASIARALPYLERDGFAWFEGRVPIQDGQACVSCHQVAFGIWSHNEAARAGVRIEHSRIGELERLAAEFVARPDKVRAVTASGMLLARSHEAAGDASVKRRSSLARGLETQQETDGHWRARGQFPTQNREIEETDAVATMWSLLAQATVDDARDLERSSREKALRWVEQAPPGSSSEWVAARMLVERTEGDTAGIAERLAALLALQNEDGGWPFRPGQPSDALSTGQALYALSVVGDPAGAEAARRAVAWLLAGQTADGTWTVPSKLTSTKPSDGKDYVYRYWGTAWAVIGLARSSREPGGI